MIRTVVGSWLSTETPKQAIWIICKTSINLYYRFETVRYIIWKIKLMKLMILLRLIKNKFYS